MSYCLSNTLVKTEPTHKTLYCLKCRSWGCETCAPERAYQLRKLCKSGKPNKFLTLTIRFQDGDSPDQAAQELARAWRLLRIRMCKRWGLRQIPFIAVWEATKRGAPHLHIFMRTRYIHQKWISEQMDDLIGSPIVNVQKIKDQRKATNYVTKYITKDAKRFNGCKRYWRSQNWDITKEQKEKEPPPWTITWTQTGLPLIQSLAIYDRPGFTIMSHKHYWIIIPPGCAGPPKTG